MDIQPSISALLYNTHAPPVLSYVAQLGLPPKALVQQERHTLTRLLHIPPNAFSRADMFNLGDWRSVDFRSMFSTLVATIVRASLVTISAWQDNYDCLLRHAEDCIGYAKVIAGTLSPDYWNTQTQPLAFTLRDASLDFPSHPLLGHVLTGIVREAYQQ